MMLSEQLSIAGHRPAVGQPEHVLAEERDWPSVRDHGDAFAGVLVHQHPHRLRHAFEEGITALLARACVPPAARPPTAGVPNRCLSSA
jgi:hypothetical protein